MIVDFDQPQSAKTVSLLMGLSDRQVRRLAEEGKIPALGDNKFMALECLHAYLNTKKAKSKPQAVDESGQIIDFDKERARKTKAEADRLERINRVEEGEYISLEEVKSDISESVAVCARILGSLKLNIARIAPQTPNRALDLIDKEQAKMLTAIIELDESYAAKADEYNALATGQ